MQGISKRVRLLIVDDSVFFRNALSAGLSEDPEIEVVGRAVDADDAVKQIGRLRPDVITLDVEMPKMNGIEFLKVLLQKEHVRVVLVSSLNISVFDALSAGAIDFVRKPDMGNAESVRVFFSELGRKVKVAAGANVRVKGLGTSTSNVLSAFGNMADSVVIAIGASTGGTEATLEIVKNFPKDTPGMVVVQHMPPGFTKMYADRLDRICKMEVREAANGDEIRTGCILIAPGDYHMTVQKSGTKYTVRCFGGEKVSGHRPSVDVLFDSVADQVKSKAIGVILTGMGRDGASGLLKMRKAGAFTIGQNEESCVVYGMPMVAYEIGAVATQASLEKIPDVIAEGLRKKA